MAIDDRVAETNHGPVRGTDDGRVKVWKGVRYAAAPVGDLRFRAPQPPEPWTEVADATAFGPACPQPPIPNVPLDLGAPQGEDCLSLNIWASSDIRPGDAKTGDGVAARWRLRSGVAPASRSTTVAGWPATGSSW